MRKGTLMSDKQKRKISQGNMGKHSLSPLLGKHISEDQRKKLAESWEKRLEEKWGPYVNQGPLIRQVITNKHSHSHFSRNIITLPTFWIGKFVRCYPVEVDGAIEEAFPTYVRPLGGSGAYISLPRSWTGKTITVHETS